MSRENAVPQWVPRVRPRVCWSSFVQPISPTKSRNWTGRSPVGLAVVGTGSGLYLYVSVTGSRGIRALHTAYFTRRHGSLLDGVGNRKQKSRGTLQSSKLARDTSRPCSSRFPWLLANSLALHKDDGFYLFILSI